MDTAVVIFNSLVGQAQRKLMHAIILFHFLLLIIFTWLKTLSISTFKIRTQIIFSTPWLNSWNRNSSLNLGMNTCFTTTDHYSFIQDCAEHCLNKNFFFLFHIQPTIISGHNLYVKEKCALLPRDERSVSLLANII